MLTTDDNLKAGMTTIAEKDLKRLRDKAAQAARLDIQCEELRAKVSRLEWELAAEEEATGGPVCGPDLVTLHATLAVRIAGYIVASNPNAKPWKLSISEVSGLAAIIIDRARKYAYDAMREGDKAEQENDG